MNTRPAWANGELEPGRRGQRMNDQPRPAQRRRSGACPRVERGQRLASRLVVLASQRVRLQRRL